MHTKKDVNRFDPSGLLLNANWAIVSDMTLYIVIPPRRGVATATQILVKTDFKPALPKHKSQRFFN